MPNYMLLSLPYTMTTWYITFDQTHEVDTCKHNVKFTRVNKCHNYLVGVGWYAETVSHLKSKLKYY